MMAYLSLLCAIISIRLICASGEEKVAAPDETELEFSATFCSLELSTNFRETGWKPDTWSGDIIFRSRDKSEILMIGIHPEAERGGQVAVRNPVFSRGTEEWGYWWVDVEFPEPNEGGERDYHLQFTESAFVLKCNEQEMFRAAYSELATEGGAHNVRQPIESVMFHLLDFNAENPKTGEVPLVPLLYSINCSYPSAVDGEWGKFGDWSECSAECGRGTQTRTRNCTNPAPAYGGAECVGEATELQDCNRHSCPAPKALTITGAELDQPKKIGRGKYSNAEDCINDVSTFAQLAARHNWVTVSLRKRAQILKVELYAPSDGPETDLTTMENANIFVATPRAAYCGIADKTTKMPVMVNGVERVRYMVTCKKYKDPLTLVGDAVKIQSSSANMKVARIVVFGVETEDDTVDFEFEEREFRTAKTLAPTEEPYNDETNKILEEPKFETSSEGVEIAKISIEEDVPYQVIEKIVEQSNATKTPLGYLAFAGYVDYSLDEETKESEEADPSVKERTTFNEDNLQTAIQSFLRFNGFVENGEISKEMVSFMQKDRCGNPDLVSNPNGDRCTTRRSVLSKPAVTNTAAFTMPGDKDRAEIVAEAESYYLELDIKFNDVRNGRSRSIFLGFNYDVLNANGHDTPLEVVALRFMRMKLCAQFLTVLEGQFLTPLVSTKTVLESCYTPTEDETKTFSFKARLDVYKHIGGLLEKVAVSIKGKEIASNVHKTPLFSSVVIMHRDDHSITMARLCKRWNLSSGYKKPVKRSRRKRFTLSNHKWGIAENTMRFNFQNYSTNLGPDGTRQGVLNALNLYSQSTGFSFQEVLPTATAEIVFMFVRDRHADGKTFHGAGVEKAHAYSPTHSEIHFNDYQTFSMNDGEKATSIFYVATHEIGHALGLLHSQQEDAVMQPGYPSNAFDLMELHDDDIRAVQTLYPELSGVGALEKLRAVEGKHSYTPKSPYPTECHSQIDAALLVKDFAYIISGPFIWRMRMTSDGWEPFDNYPKRVTDVFQQTYGAVEALFKTESGDSITVFALFGGDMISKYRIIPRDGNAEPIVILLDAKTKRRDFLSKQSILIDENIRSAFTYNDKTILVADNLEQYYEVSWMFNKKGAVKGVKEIISNNDMNSLIGRKLQKVHFNAAMTIEQNVDGETREMIYMFGASFVYVENPFPSTSSKAKYWFKVPNHFKVAGWCPARD